jgi:hypothetical protein
LLMMERAPGRVEPVKAWMHPLLGRYSIFEPA